MRSPPNISSAYPARKFSKPKTPVHTFIAAHMSILPRETIVSKGRRHARWFHNTSENARATQISQTQITDFGGIIVLPKVRNLVEFAAL